MNTPGTPGVFDCFSDLEPLAPDQRIPAQIVRRALENDLPVPHHVHPLGQIECDRGLLLDPQARRAA